MRNQGDFGLQIRVSYRLVLLLLMGTARHAQSTQNNKFAMSLLYFKKKVRDKCDFLHEDKHQTFLQAGSIVFTVHSQVCSNYPKQQICNIFAISQK